MNLDNGDRFNAGGNEDVNRYQRREGLGRDHVYRPIIEVLPHYDPYHKRLEEILQLARKRTTFWSNDSWVRSHFTPGPSDPYEHKHVMKRGIIWFGYTFFGNITHLSRDLSRWVGSAFIRLDIPVRAILPFIADTMLQITGGLRDVGKLAAKVVIFTGKQGVRGFIK